MVSRVLHVGAPVAHQVHLAGIGRQAQREVDPPHRGEDVGDHAAAARKPGNVVEHHRRRPHGALVDVDDAADLFVAPGAGDGGQLAGLLHLRQPDAEILLGRILGRIAQALVGTRRDGVQHGGSWGSSVASMKGCGKGVNGRRRTEEKGNPIIPGRCNAPNPESSRRWEPARPPGFRVPAFAGPGMTGQSGRGPSVLRRPSSVLLSSAPYFAPGAMMARTSAMISGGVA